MNTAGRFSAILIMEATFVTFCLLCFLHIRLLLKRIYSKREDFAAKGSKVFPFRVDLFSEGRQTILTEWSPLMVYLMPLGMTVTLNIMPAQKDDL